MRTIPIAEPWITDLERDYATRAITNLSYLPHFEKKFAEYVGRIHAIATPSCTSAIHLALAALGIGEGDEVIVPTHTWIGSSAPITYVGATPVFCNVDRKTWCIDVEALKIAITPRTRAIIAVDLYGGMPEYDEIINLAAKLNINVIEDAAEAIGSEYNGHKAGGFGTASCFSFHGSKTMSCGEGGMLVTDDIKMYERVRKLQNHGRIAPSLNCEEVAYKYVMSSVQAGLGLAQLERVQELVAKKIEIFECYRERLKDVDGITMNHQPHNVKNSYWMTTITFDDRSIFKLTKLMTHFKEKSIGVRPFFSPLNFLPAYYNYKKDNNCLNIVGVNLPSGLIMTEEEIQYVCDNVKEALNEI